MRHTPHDRKKDLRHPATNTSSFPSQPALSIFPSSHPPHPIPIHPIHPQGPFIHQEKMAAIGFSSLPERAKTLIYKLALPEDEPEVCIVWPLVIEAEHRGPTLPLVVDVAFPALMHVSREARRFVLSEAASGVRFRESALAGVRVPFRRFRPELDTLYVGQSNFQWLANAVVDRAVEKSFLSTAPNIAVELSSSVPWDGLSNNIFEWANALRNLYIVMPDLTTLADVQGPFQAPYRRCKLKVATEDEQSAVRITDQYMDEQGFDNIKTLCVEEIAISYDGRFDQSPDGLLISERAASDDIDESKRAPFLVVNIRPAALVEWHDGEFVCRGNERLFMDNERPPYISPEFTLPPEQFRVNDLDANVEGVGFMLEPPTQDLRVTHANTQDDTQEETYPSGLSVFPA